MKKTVLLLLITFIAAASSVQAEVNVNVSVGVPGPREVVPPPPRVVVSAPPAVLFDVDPDFVAPPGLGFYVGVDTPYDIIFSSDYYYLYYGNSWHRSRHHNGPWVNIPYRQLPPGIRKHRIEQIRLYRDREYGVYRKDRDHYRGRHFRAGHERKDERRHDKQEWKDDRRREKEARKDEHRRDKEERQEEKRDRKHDKHDRD